MKKIYTFFWFLSAQIISAQTILGIDVSHHQGAINWQLVANDGKVFAYCKATEGMTYHDPNFTTYMTGGTNAGIVMGAYHFARPDNNTATQDADNFINTASSYIGDGFLPPVLDLEDPNANTHLDQLFTSSQLTAWVQTWLNRVESQTGVQPILYLNSHYAYYLNNSLTSYGLWIAKPGTSPTTPPNNSGNWNNWLFKQYSWEGNVNGISGNVDLDSFHGSVSDFNNLTGIDSIPETKTLNIKFYPNPVHHTLNIEPLNNRTITEIKIFDLSGRLLRQINQDISKIDVSSLRKGVYLMQVILDNKQTSIMKFLKN